MTESDHRRVALVTGGSRGIGLALVRRFREAGFLVAAGATTEEGAARSGAELSFACDVARPDDVERAIDAVLARFGRLDVVVNNAGLAGSNPLEAGSDDALWYRMLDVNLSGTYLVSKRALPHLPDGSGRIINIASTLGLKGVPDQTAYCAAKHGVVGFTRALALHLAPRRVTVNAICPGWVRTDMAGQRARELGTTEDALASGVPLGRMVEPDEVAKLALYLTTDAAASITGQTLTIDGGSLA